MKFNNLNLNFYAANRTPDRIAVLDYDTGREYCYGELNNRARRLASYLVNTLGLKKGDCIGFFATNDIAFFDAFFATYLTGIIITSYNYFLNEGELKDLMQTENPKVLFYEPAFETKISKIKAELKVEKYICIGERSSAIYADFYEDIMTRQYEELRRIPLLDAEDIQMYIHTGGTTGVPKAAMLSYRAITANAISEIITLGIHIEDSAYVFLPLFHTAGWNVVTLPLLFCGGRIILKKNFDPGSALKIIREQKPTISIAVPTIYKLMAEHCDFKKTDFSCYKWMLVGAAPVQESIINRYLERNVKMINAYGMTEVGPNNLSHPVNDMAIRQIHEKWNSVGKPMYFNEVRIVDEQGCDVESGECGELIFKGPLTFSGYLNQKEESENALKEGWIYTGDIARIDEDGYFYIVGRRKNMYIVGGENIFPNEIEELISKFEAVKECCVFGVEDEKLGEVGKAIIVVEQDHFKEEELRAYLKANLSSIKVPKYIQQIKKIPRNQVGKIDYRAVYQLYQ